MSKPITNEGDYVHTDELQIQFGTFDWNPKCERLPIIERVNGIFFVFVGGLSSKNSKDPNGRRRYSWRIITKLFIIRNNITVCVVPLRFLGLRGPSRLIPDRPSQSLSTDCFFLFPSSNSDSTSFLVTYILISLLAVPEVFFHRDTTTPVVIFSSLLSLQIFAYVGITSRGFYVFRIRTLTTPCSAPERIR